MSLEDLRKKRIEQLQEQMLQQQSPQLHQQIQEQARLQQQIETIENLAKQNMTREAITRYGNLKSAHPEKAIQAVAIIAQSIQTRQIREKIDDQTFKQLLQQLEKPKKEFKMTRK